MISIQKIRHLSVLAILLTPIASFSADVDKTLEWVSGGEVKVSITAGRIEFRGWDRNEVKLDGDYSDDDSRLTFKQSGKNVILEVKHERSSWWGGGSNSKVDFVVFTPFESDLDIDGTSLDVEIEGINGNLDIGSISGAVIVNGSDQNKNNIRADIETVSGDIDIDNTSGKIRLRSVSGDINSNVNAQTFDAKTVSGDIEGNIGSTEYASVLSVSGDIDIELKLEDGARVEGQTVSGNLELNFNDKVNADFELNTGPGGDIRNRLSDDKPDDNNRWGQELDFTLNNGDSTIELETMSGTIKLHQ